MNEAGGRDDGAAGAAARTAAAGGRDYAAALAGVRTMDESGSDREAEMFRVMQAVVDALWTAFSGEAAGTFATSWLGFYVGPGERTHRGETAGADAMLLGPSCEKPACSPIGLHGACGRSLLTNRSLVVNDVAALGEGYVACDPKDRSELVIPLTRAGERRPFAVFDADSFDVGAFDAADAEALHSAFVRLGLTAGPAPPVEVIGG